MAERLNIWGKPGCELPNGQLCNACCILPEIELEGCVGSLKKPANTPCPNLSEDGQGCKFHLTGDKPENCQSWHCSQLSEYNKSEYVAQAISSGIVSNSEAVRAMENLLSGKVNPSVIGDRVTQVFLTADDLTRITMSRELVPGEPDEP